MKQQFKQYLDDPHYITLKQAAEEAGINVITFKKYARNIGIAGIPVSKYTFFKKDDVAKVRGFIEKQANVWLRLLEQATHKRWAPVEEKE